VVISQYLRLSFCLTSQKSDLLFCRGYRVVVIFFQRNTLAQPACPISDLPQDSGFRVVSQGLQLSGRTQYANFVASLTLPTGTNTVPVIARNYGGQLKTNNYQVVVSAGGTQTLTYDLNGNLINDGSKTYEWDAANRLTAVNYTSSSNRTEMSYDGLSRRSKIVEKNSSRTVTSTKQFIWCGNELCEERDASNAVTKRFYPLGQQISATSYYYTRDHLGSIREMTDGSGTIQARYDYDLYGRVTKVSGSLDSDFQYAGYYQHSPSGLNLTKYRAYSADLGRWQSRDPIGEAGGINVYAYVGNNPISYIDPWGLIIVTASEFAQPGELQYSAYGPYNYGPRRDQGPPIDPNQSGASLPARVPAGTTVTITNPANGKSITAPVLDIGPWNVRDNYWNNMDCEGSRRPLSEQQYANQTIAQDGKIPENPAGIDLTPATLDALGISGPVGTRQAKVDWHFSK
jgi:RHS repeat-associated protein